MASRRTPRERGRRGGRADRQPLPRGFGSIWGVVALDLVGFGLVIPVLPLYAERFHASATTIGALVASYSLAQFLFAPVWGRVSDRIGRRPVLVLALVGTAVGSLLTGLAHGLPLLFAGRIVDGASGASVAVAQAAASDLATPEERPRLLGLLGAAFGIGFVLGPSIGGAFALISPRAPFFVAAALAGANAISAWSRIPETNPAGERAAPGERRAGGLRTALRDQLVLTLVASAFLALAAFSGFEATFSLFAKAVLDIGESATYWLFAGVGLLLVVVNVRLVKPMVHRLGEQGAVRAGLATNAAGLLLLAVAGIGGRWLVVVPALAVLTVGQGLVTPTLASALAGRVDRGRRGQVLGAQQSAGALARVVGPLVASAAFQHVGRSAPYLVGAVVLVAAVGLLSATPSSSAPLPVTGE